MLRSLQWSEMSMPHQAATRRSWPCADERSFGRDSVKLFVGSAFAPGSLASVGWLGEIVTDVREIKMEKGRGVVWQGNGGNKGHITDDMEGRRHGCCGDLASICYSICYIITRPGLVAMSCLFGLFFLLLPWPLSVPHYMSAVSPMQSLSEHPSCPSPTLFLEIPTAIFPSILTFGIMAPATLCLSEASMDKLM